MYQQMAAVQTAQTRTFCMYCRSENWMSIFALTIIYLSQFAFTAYFAFHPHSLNSLLSETSQMNLSNLNQERENIS